MAQTATAHVEQVSTPYYRKPYDKKAEHRRGYWLLGIFAFLSVATLFLWIWHHVPDLFAEEGQWTWQTFEDMHDYLDWFLASLIGVLVYVMANVGQFLPKIAKEEANFRAYTGWYVSTIIRGVIIAQVVMWLLINLELKVSGDAIALSFGAMPPIVLTGAAFILGYYSRVARAQLDEITRMLFSKAWLLAK